MLKFTGIDGKPMHINPAQVTFICEESDNERCKAFSIPRYTMIAFDYNNVIFVKDPIDEVAAALKG